MLFVNAHDEMLLEMKNFKVEMMFVLFAHFKTFGFETFGLKRSVLKRSVLNVRFRTLRFAIGRSVSDVTFRDRTFGLGRYVSRSDVRFRTLRCEIERTNKRTSDAVYEFFFFISFIIMIKKWQFR